MQHLKLHPSALRIGAPLGLLAALVVWAAFVLNGGAGGAARLGNLLPMAVFLAEVVLYALAGYRAARHGEGPLVAMQAGLAAGLTAGLLADFPKTAILFLSPGYMNAIQRTPEHFNARHLYMPWAPLRVLFALVGAALAGAAIGAACGAIGGALARTGAAREKSPEPL